MPAGQRRRRDGGFAIRLCAAHEHSEMPMRFSQGDHSHSQPDRCCETLDRNPYIRQFASKLFLLLSRRPQNPGRSLAKSDVQTINPRRVSTGMYSVCDVGVGWRLSREGPAARQRRCLKTTTKQRAGSQESEVDFNSIPVNSMLTMVHGMQECGWLARASH